MRKYLQFPLMCPWNPLNPNTQGHSTACSIAILSGDRSVPGRNVLYPLAPTKFPVLSKLVIALFWLAVYVGLGTFVSYDDYFGEHN